MPAGPSNTPASLCSRRKRPLILSAALQRGIRAARSWGDAATLPSALKVSIDQPWSPPGLARQKNDGALWRCSCTNRKATAGATTAAELRRTNQPAHLRRSFERCSARLRQVLGARAQGTIARAQAKWQCLPGHPAERAATPVRRRKCQCRTRHRHPASQSARRPGASRMSGRARLDQLNAQIRTWRRSPRIRRQHRPPGLAVKSLESHADKIMEPSRKPAS